VSPYIGNILASQASSDMQAEMDRIIMERILFLELM